MTICSVKSTPSAPKGKNPPCVQRLEKLAVFPRSPNLNRMIVKPRTIIATAADGVLNLAFNLVGLSFGFDLLRRSGDSVLVHGSFSENVAWVGKVVSRLLK